jgi:hypothetical protein
LSFVDPLAAALAEGIDVVLNDIPAEGSLGATAMEKLRQLARKLSSPSSARAFAKAIRDGVSGAGTGDADVAAQADDYIVSLPQQPVPTTPPLPGPAVAPKASSPVSDTPSSTDAAPAAAAASAPAEAITGKDGDKQTKTASKPAAAPAAQIDVPVAAPAEAPVIPLTNDDLDVLFGTETRQLAPTFTVPEDLLRKAMGL